MYLYTNTYIYKCVFFRDVYFAFRTHAGIDIGTSRVPVPGIEEGEGFIFTMVNPWQTSKIISTQWAVSSLRDSAGRCFQEDVTKLVVYAEAVLCQHLCV